MVLNVVLLNHCFLLSQSVRVQSVEHIIVPAAIHLLVTKCSTNLQT